MKRGFTLIEFSVFVICVSTVAILVLPGLMKDHAKRVLTKQLQMTHVTLQSGMKSYLKDMKVKKLYYTKAFNKNRSPKDLTAFLTFLTEEINPVKVCTTANNDMDTCKGSEYKRLNGAVEDTFGGEVCAILKTGATVCFNRMAFERQTPYLFIDVNGPNKGPNVWGRDAFRLIYNNYGDVAESFMATPLPINQAAHCQDNQFGGGCFNRITGTNWSMDY